jgi:2-polyprenyl-6-methoxyphenol hydroxylase-like FAD-dependent oxidoreductase
VVERDPADPSAPLDAWGRWERRGVNQFRQLHYFLPRFRERIEAELADVAAALDEHGALRFNPITSMPAQMSGGVREDDSRFEVLTGRRPFVEAVIAGVAAEASDCKIRRGVAVQALHADDAIRRIDGVVLDNGERIDADVIIDATGRRTPLAKLLDDLGAERPVEERHDFGFVYYARHFRSADGSIPPVFGPLLQPYDSVSVVTLPADNGYWGVGIVASAKDHAVRAVRDPAVWERVVRSYPLIAHWLEGEPQSDDIEVIAKIEDRYRTFCIDGQPVAPGVLPVGDSFACTNPSIGRGASIGLMHAVALRDLLRVHDTSDAQSLSRAWHEITETTVGGYVRDTMDFDGHRLAEIDAQIEGRTYEPNDPGFDLGRALTAASSQDPELLRGYLEVVSVLSRAIDVLVRPGVAERAIAIASASPPASPPGPSRSELVSLLGS